MLSLSATLKDFIQGREHRWKRRMKEPIEEEIVNQGRNMGLVVNAKDINDILAEDIDELTTDKLVALQQEQEKERSTEVTEKEEEEFLTTLDIFKAVGKCA